MKYYIILVCWLIASCTSMVQRSRFSDSEIESTEISKSTTVNSKPSEAIIIDMDNAFGHESINTDNLMDNIWFLPLETTDESIFNGIRKIEISNERIYIMDYNDGILIFGKNGKFITKLTKGQGPGEVIGVWDFAFDEKRKQLIVYDESDFLKFYDQNGKFITEQKTPFMFHEFCTFDDGYVFFQPEFLNTHLGDNARYAVLKANQNQQITMKGVSLSEHGLIRQPPFITKGDNKITISQLANDTIFEMYPSNIVAKYVLKYDKNKVDISDMNQVKVSEKYYHCSGFIENSRFQIFHFYSHKSGLYRIIRDKDTGKMIGGKSATCTFGLIPHCFPILSVHDDFFVSDIQPCQGMRFTSSVISETENKKLENLTEEDNVALVFFKFKEIK